MRAISSRLAGSTPILLAITLSAFASLHSSAARAARLTGHVPAAAIARSQPAGPLAAETPLSLALTLPLRNQAELGNLLHRLYDPADPLYGHYLSPGQFTEAFGPTQDDYNAVIGFALSHGLSITGTHSNRLVLDVSGPAAAVEQSFGLHLLQYHSPAGREFYAPDADPAIPDALAGKLTGVVGLDNATPLHTHSRPLSLDPLASPLQIGSGPGGGLTPADTKTAYNLNGITANGSGETLALFELAGYRASDISAYESYFGLAAPPLQNVLVDGASGSAGSGADEVTLDIELMVALAPGASKVMVYEGPNTASGVIDTYNKIATDNLAREISTSWGLAETSNSSSAESSENSIFAQMAAQGQSIFAAAGDSGAYDNGSSLSVDDPASQPNVTGVGGTELFVNTGETYNHESTWNVNGTVNGGAGGGGISVIWTIPSYQQGVISAASKGSTTARNVPDVSLNADQYTGYAIYYNGAWTIYGGTSCAAPLWAAFTALANQQRLLAGSSVLGFANPTLYQIGQGVNYTLDFHDIADGSTNLYYPAVTGYDLATGWGSFNGASLLADLAPGGVTVTNPPAAPSGLTASAGNAQVALSWTGVSGASSYNVYRGTSTGGESTTPVATGVTSTSWTDTAVTNGVTYYYTVAAVNSAGTSGYSPEASATPAAPALAITGGPTASASKTAATIKWSTNIAASSTVHYGLSSGSLTGTASSGTLVTSHSVGLGGLIRRRTYYYTVSSTASGVTVTSSVHSFRTN